MVTYLLLIAELFIYQLDTNIIYNLIFIYIVFFQFTPMLYKHHKIQNV